MRFCLLNQSSDADITKTTLARIAVAVERQLFEHVSPMWETEGAFVHLIDKESDAPKDASLIVVLDSADVAGALGYHALTPEGRPYAKCFWGPIRASGGQVYEGNNSLAVTISHEAIEALLDPYCSFWSNDDSGLLYALEGCDAVEADSYELEGVSLSNFVSVRFFRSGDGPYDYMRLCTRPFETRPGGYQIIGATPATAQAVFAEGYPDWKRESKAHAAARTARRTRLLSGGLA